MQKSQKSSGETICAEKSKDVSVVANPPTVRKRIGTTVYEVRVFFDHAAKETMSDKILRLIESDLEKIPSGNMKTDLWARRLPEGGCI